MKAKLNCWEVTRSVRNDDCKNVSIKLNEFEQWKIDTNNANILELEKFLSKLSFYL